MPNIFKFVDKASEKPFNLAVGAASLLAKEVWRRPIATPFTVFAGAVVLKAIDDHSISRERRKLSAYIAAHMPHHHEHPEEPAAIEYELVEQNIESIQELELSDR